ncbi:MAG: S1C family serine protease [Rhodospirillales bacterium]
MKEDKDWRLPPNLQPKPEDVGYDLDAALSAVVGLRSEVPEDAFTAGILGTERAGNGVVIRDDGLVLTVGYLITEAETIWLSTARGAVVPGHPLAYDQATGFGIVQALGKLGLPALQRGSAARCRRGDQAVMAGHGGRARSLKVHVLAKREFAGYWEYVLDEAIFTVPAHPNWGGAALVDAEGRLAGIGSLLVQERIEDKEIQGNMVVPIDLLDPILDDLLRYGRVNRPPRPWLGMYTTEFNTRLVVAGLARGGPAERAKVEVGDMVLAVAGVKVTGLADLYRRIWALGRAGVEAPLTLMRGGERVEAVARSVDRNDFLKKPRLH